MATVAKMNDLVNRYVDLRRDTAKTRTCVQYESVLGRFAEEWDRTRRVPSSITEEWVSDWLHEFRHGRIGGRGQQLTNGSYNNAVVKVQAFLEWALKRDPRMDHRVLDACGPAPKDPPKDYLQLTAAQVVHMVESATDPWERWVLTLASQTLGRDSELRSRHVRHMRPDLGRLAWFRQKTTNTDDLPITRQLADEWTRWREVYEKQCGNLQPGWRLIPARFKCGWGNSSQQRWRYEPVASPKTVAPIVQKHAARVAGLTPADLKGQGVHILRRSMARALYERLKEDGHPRPVVPVQTMLGHADAATTMRYIRLQPDREERDELLAGSNLLWAPTGNVVPIRAVK